MHFDKDNYKKKEKDIEELNKQIFKLQGVLHSLQNSYKKLDSLVIDEKCVDGVEIDLVEYGILYVIIN